MDAGRDRVQEALQETGAIDSEDRAAVLTGWVVVTEWMDEGGNKWLGRWESEALTDWQATGMLHEALHGDWPAPDDE